MTIERIQQLIDCEIKPRSEASIFDFGQSDFDEFMQKYEAMSIDGRFSCGEQSLFVRFFDNSLTEMQCDNRGPLKALLFTIFIGENSALKASTITDIMPLIDRLPDEVDITWGLISDTTLSPDELKLFMISAFDTCQS